MCVSRWYGGVLWRLGEEGDDDTRRLLQPSGEAVLMRPQSTWRGHLYVPDQRENRRVSTHSGHQPLLRRNGELTWRRGLRPGGHTRNREEADDLSQSDRAVLGPASS